MQYLDRKCDLILNVKCFNTMSRDFPSGAVVKNPPCHTRDVGSIPGRGTKIPHAAGQLSPRAATSELMRSAARAPQ